MSPVNNDKPLRLAATGLSGSWSGYDLSSTIGRPEVSPCYWGDEVVGQIVPEPEDQVA